MELLRWCTGCCSLQCLHNGNYLFPACSKCNLQLKPVKCNPGRRRRATERPHRYARWPVLTLGSAIVYILATQMWTCLALSVEIGTSFIGHASTYFTLDCEVITGIGCTITMSTNETSTPQKNCTVKMPGDSESGLADSRWQSPEVYAMQLVGMTYLCTDVKNSQHLHELLMSSLCFSYLFVYHNDHTHGTYKMKKIIKTQWKLNCTHKIDNTVNFGLCEQLQCIEVAPYKK